MTRLLHMIGWKLQPILFLWASLNFYSFENALFLEVTFSIARYFWEAYVLETEKDKWRNLASRKVSN